MNPSNRICQSLLVIITLLVTAAPAARETVVIPSAAMRASYRAVIIYPKDYAKSGKQYPVIYALHGYSQNFAVWSRVAPLDSFADHYQVIFVCPDGDYNSWYLDSPAKSGVRFETYLTREVVAFVEKKYRTIPQADARAIMGSSMGGHGAMTLLAKHPDLYRGGGSISGIMDLEEFPSQWDIARVLGEHESHAKEWKNASFVNLASKLTGEDRGLILIAGDADFALPGNRRAHEELLRLKVPHEFIMSPGGHTPLFVRQNAGIVIAYLMGLMKRAL